MHLIIEARLAVEDDNMAEEEVGLVPLFESGPMSGRRQLRLSKE